jgi:hypothetical protein
MYTDLHHVWNEPEPVTEMAAQVGLRMLASSVILWLVALVVAETLL